MKKNYGTTELIETRLLERLRIESVPSPKRNHIQAVRFTERQLFQPDFFEKLFDALPDDVMFLYTYSDKSFPNSLGGFAVRPVKDGQEIEDEVLIFAFSSDFPYNGGGAIAEIEL